MRKFTSNRFVIVIGAIFLFSTLQAGLTISIHSLLQGNTPGMDFHIYWVAGHAIGKDISPYGDEVALESQLGVLKRPARADEDQMGFAYPLYALLPVLPTLWLSFDWAQPFWLAFNLLALSTALFLAFPKAPLRALLLSLPYYPLTFALILGNLNILVTAIIIISTGLMIFQRHREPGLQIAIAFLLAWTTIKPQFSWLYLLFFLVFFIKEKMWHAIFGLACGFIVFNLLAFLIYPNWISEWVSRLNLYTSYVNSSLFIIYLLSQFLPPFLARSIGYGLIFIITITTFSLAVKWWKNNTNNLSLLAWIGLLSYLITPHGVSYEQMRFFIPLLFWLVLSPRKNFAWWIFGLGTILLSWAVFVLARFNPQLPAIDDIRFLFFLFWLLWLFLQTNFLKHDRGVNLESIPS